MKSGCGFNSIIVSAIFLSAFSTSLPAFANRKSDPALPIDHCYHWLKERSSKYLTYKYQYASKNKGELTFYTTPETSGGAVAGPGLYCAKTPIGSLSYGDRIVRIDFQDDVVFKNTAGSKVCGTNGKFYPNQSDCNSKAEDVHFYDSNSEWYVIKNPQVVKSWTANDDILIKDLIAAKQDGNDAADAHIDLTLQAIQAETQVIGKKKLYNGKGRMTIDDLVKNASARSQIPPLSLIAMVANQAGSTQVAFDPAQVYEEEFTRAIEDSLLTTKDFQSTLSSLVSDKRVSQAFEAILKKIDFSQLNKYNTSVLIAYFDELDIKLSEVQVDSLWNAAIGGMASLTSIQVSDLKPQGQFKKRFHKSLPSPDILAAKINDANIVDLFKMLDSLSDSGLHLSEYTKKLFEKLLAGSKSTSAPELFDSIKNNSLEKEKALADILLDSSKNGFHGMDPIYLGGLFERGQAKLSASDNTAIKNAILKLPLKISSKLSYVELEEFKLDKIKLPSFYPSKTYLVRLIQKSIAERTLGKNTTNTFRLILSGTFHLFNDRIKKNAAAAAAIQREAADFFLDLTKELIQSNDRSYAYISMQNAGFYLGEMKYREHAIEHLIADYKNGNTEFDELMETAIPNALDTSALYFLTSNHHDPKVKELLTLTMKYLASSELRQYLSSSNFAAAQAEKRTWMNITRNPKLCRDGDCKKSDRISGDFCAFITALKRSQPYIESANLKLEFNNAEAALMPVASGICSK